MRNEAREYIILLSGMVVGWSLTIDVIYHRWGNFVFTATIWSIAIFYYAGRAIYLFGKNSS